MSVVKASPVSQFMGLHESKVPPTTSAHHPPYIDIYTYIIHDFAFTHDRDELYLDTGRPSRHLIQRCPLLSLCVPACFFSTRWERGNPNR